MNTIDSKKSAIRQNAPAALGFAYLRDGFTIGPEGTRPVGAAFMAEGNVEMVLTMIAAGDESEGAAPRKAHAPGNGRNKSNATGEDFTITASRSTPQKLADLVRLSTYPDTPVDVLGALRGRGYVIIEVDLGVLAGVVIRDGGAGAVILNSALPEPERNWTAAVLLYKALAVRGKGPEVEGLPEGTLQNDAYQVNAEAFAGAMLMPRGEVRKVWERETKAGKDTYQKVKILGGAFAVPEVRARARAVELGLITER